MIRNPPKPFSNNYGPYINSHEPCTHISGNPGFRVSPFQISELFSSDPTFFASYFTMTSPVIQQLRRKLCTTSVCGSLLSLPTKKKTYSKSSSWIKR